MHMKFSTCTENTWAINKSLLSYPSKTYPYSLETVSMATVHNFMYFVFLRLTRSTYYRKKIYLYININERCLWDMSHKNPQYKISSCCCYGYIRQQPLPYFAGYSTHLCIVCRYQYLYQKTQIVRTGG